MKKIFNLLLLLAAATLYSCTSDVDEVFDKSSADRINESIAKDKEILTSAENGWLMKYYPDANTYGGYTILCKFDKDESVSLMTDALGSETKATSHYTLEQSAGVVLSFDEYNDVMHFFSDPRNPYGIGDNGKGMEGDFEFRINSASADSIVMYGKKHGSKIVMTPTASGVDHAQFIDKLTAQEKDETFMTYSCEANGVAYIVSQDFNNFRVLTFNKADGTGNPITAPYIVTEKGIEFYKPLELEGITLNSLEYKSDNAYTFESSNAGFKMNGYIYPSNQLLNVTDWYFSYSNLGELTQQYWAAGYKTLSQVFDMYYACLTNVSGYITFYSALIRKADNNQFAGYYLYDVKLIGDNQIQFGNPIPGNNNSNIFYNYYGLNYIISPLTGTFTIQVDNEKNPTALMLQDNENPDNSFKLSKYGIAYPFKQ